MNVCVSFFFSSRRRHTRSKRDWSSDVCSSDLDLKTRVHLEKIKLVRHIREQKLNRTRARVIHCATDLHCRFAHPPPQLRIVYRSEERRVGKECRSRGAPAR